MCRSVMENNQKRKSKGTPGKLDHLISQRKRTFKVCTLRLIEFSFLPLSATSLQLSLLTEVCTDLGRRVYNES